jgi:hypothetical protein
VPPLPDPACTVGSAASLPACAWAGLTAVTLLLQALLDHPSTMAFLFARPSAGVTAAVERKPKQHIPYVVRMQEVCLGKYQYSRSFNSLSKIIIADSSSVLQT